ncbi:MAG: hypothetical protein ACYDBP_14755 [Leptospirales bacterium]
MGGGGPNIPTPSTYSNPYVNQYGSSQQKAFTGMQGLANSGTSLANKGNSLFSAYYGNITNPNPYSKVSNASSGLYNATNSATPGMSTAYNLSGANGQSPYLNAMNAQTPYDTALAGLGSLGNANLNGAANSILNQAFNPQTGLYNTMAGDQSQQVQAALANSGLANTGAGMNTYQNAMDQFNQNWANQQFANQQNGANTAAGLYNSILGQNANALGSSQGLLNNLQNTNLNSALSGLSGYQSLLGNQGNLLSGLAMMPNQTASSLLGLGNNALSGQYGNLGNASNMLSSVFNSAQTPINGQNQLATNMLNLANSQAQGNKAGIGQGIGGVMNLGGSLGSGYMMSNALGKAGAAGAVA